MKKLKRTTRRKKEIVTLKNRSEQEIDTKDIPEVRDWDSAVQGRLYRPVKTAISLRLDADVLAWFKARNAKYQSKINEILRDCIRQHK